MTEYETILRDEVQRLNSNALLDVLRETGVVLRAETFRHWRPTVRAIGAIGGVSQVKATILATDGNLGLFVDESGSFFGHIQHFSGRVKTLFSAAKDGVTQNSVSDEPYIPRAKKPKAPRKDSVAHKAQELLKELGIDL